MALRARTSSWGLSALLSIACGDAGAGPGPTDPGPTSLAEPSAPATGTPDSEAAPTTSTSDVPATGSASQASAPDTESTPSTPTSLATSDSADTDATTADPPCATGPAGAIECDGATAKTCDGMGGVTGETACPKQCADGLGCVECVPGSGQCVGELSQICDDQGAGYVDAQTCDPLQGVTCDANSGQCVGACAALGSLSYIGCDYYPVVTQQLDFYVEVNANPYAVAVANTTAEPAAITITRGDAPVAQDMVPAASVKVLPLPWIGELALDTGPSVLVPGGAYRLRSTRPVTVYQYNMLNAAVTNDASLLLPVNTWTGRYVVAAWQHWTVSPGFVSVTARFDGTTVTLTPPKGGQPTQPGGGVDGLGNGVVALNEGDVLQVKTAAGGDLTGMLVSADRPVQVVGGHDCTNVPVDVNACDHLEEAMFPVETLATEYIVVPPVQVPNEAADKPVIVRVIAPEAATTLTFDPDQPVAKFLASAGDFVELPPTTEEFMVRSDRRILVAEYMIGQEADLGNSDPAMVLAVPSAQYRSSYLLYAQPGWEANFVDIIAPAGASVQVDGAAVAGFAPIGATNFSLAHVKLTNAGDGSHTVTSDRKVGISVYGIQNYGSYWYPGGLDLAVIPQ